METESLYTLLNDSLQGSLGDNEKFLPFSVLDEWITKQKVKEVLPLVMRFFPRGLVKRITTQAKKLFAILVLIGEPNFIRDLLSEKITDRDLPFSRKHAGGDVVKSSQGHDVHGFVSWKNPAKVNTFLEKQWCVLAQSLEFSDRHILIDEKRRPLPVLGMKEVGNSHYSRVYKSAIHSAHRPDSLDGDLEIALKKFPSHTDFFKERKILEDIRDIDNPHLIRYLTTWEYREAYYIIFPWANGGNLKELWKSNKSCEIDPHPELWALKQMLGLTSALRDLHDKNCRHGDLKPENILCFNTNGQNVLVVADVGVSRIHDQVTKFRKDGTTTNATTPSYEPPEVILEKDMPRSRKYDIWSLGCIFLEFLNWVFFGYKAVEDLYSGGRLEFIFYELVDSKTPRVRPKAIEKIEQLRRDERCKGKPIEALVDLIAERLLMVNVDERDTADQLYKKLEQIVRDAELTKAQET